MYGLESVEPSWSLGFDSRLNVDLPTLDSSGTVGPSTPIAEVLRDREAGISAVTVAQPSSASSGLAGLASPFLAAVGAVASGAAGVFREKLRLDHQKELARAGVYPWSSWLSGLSPSMQMQGVNSLFTFGLLAAGIVVVFLLFARRS